VGLKEYVMALEWEYCECGCHGHEGGVQGNMLWIYNDLKDNFYLHRGHGFTSPRVGVYKTWEEASAKGNEVFREGALKLQEKLGKLLEDEPAPPVPTKKATKSRFNRKSPV
jgi:hypothetical protein